MIEIWKDIPNYENIYQVSNLGRVKSLSRNYLKKGKYHAVSKERILKPGITNGYNVAILSKNGKIKGYGVHVLVAMAFLGHLPNGHKIVPNHINGIKTDNQLDNLELITQRENVDKYYTGQKTSSVYTGVSFDKNGKKWVTEITIDGKKRYLGRFKTEYEAHYAYQSVLLTLKNN